MNNMKQKKTFLILALLLMTAVGATAQTTYTVTVKEGTEDAANWSADPNPAGEGQSVTIKYDGTKKVKSVTAVQKTLRPLAKATTADLGKIAGADGIIYGTKAAAEAAGTQAVAMIAYVGSETDHTTYKHGLAIALADESCDGWAWAESACEAKNTSTPVANASWLLPSQNQWNAMFKANGGDEKSYTGLDTALATAGGDSSKLQEGDNYWSSTLYNDYVAYRLSPADGVASWDSFSVVNDFRARACLAF